MFSSKSMFFGWVTFVALAAAVFSATPATAELILYSDTFNRGSSGSPAALNGAAPARPAVDEYGAKASATWTANSGITTDGLQANVSSVNSGDNCGLPFTPEANHVYTVSVTLDCTSSGANWLAMGFSKGITTANCQYYYIDGYDGSSGPYGWAAFRNDTSQYKNGANAGPQFAGGADMSPGTDMGELNVKELLNTNVTPWTCQFIVNNVSEWGPTALGSGYSSIGYISFGTDSSTTGYIKNFQLSVDVVPEPSSLALLAGGLFGLLCYAWRKRR